MQLAARKLSAPAEQERAPIAAAEFDQWMNCLGPFERAPCLAVAVSGGRDSMALALLAKDWADAQGGQVLAVTVDHGLRPESSIEAEQVGRWMAARGIAHHALRWETPEQESGIEAAARTARYALLETFCRAQGVLHLLVGHHQDDQIETHVMRRLRGSGVAGLAGMAAIREMTGMRVLRPLLCTPRARIAATLRSRGQGWIEDPSNQDIQFARARMRVSGESGVSAADVREHGHARVAHERAAAELAARAVGVDPSGFAWLDIQAFREGPDHISRTVLANVITCVSGRVYPPRGARLDRLWARIIAGDMDRARTLAGCIIRPAGSGKICVLREMSGVSAAVHRPRATMRWDNRFALILGGPAGDRHVLDAVGRGDQSQIAELAGVLGLPRDVCSVLPALFEDERIVAYPSFRPIVDPSDPTLRKLYVRFAPQKPVSGVVFGKV